MDVDEVLPMLLEILRILHGLQNSLINGLSHALRAEKNTLLSSEREPLLRKGIIIEIRRNFTREIQEAKIGDSNNHFLTSNYWTYFR